MSSVSVRRFPGLFVTVAIGLLVATTAFASEANHARFSQYNDAEWAAAYAAAKTKRDFRVESMAAFKELGLYYEREANSGTVRNSFDLKPGDHVHCIDVDTQPPLAKGGAAASAPPSLPLASTGSSSVDSEALAAMFGMDNSFDAEGNVRRCSAGTIPKRIPSLDVLFAHRNLKEYFQKSPDGGVAPPVAQASPVPDGVSVQKLRPGALSAPPHEWAHAYRGVTNWGAKGTFNVWNPFVEQTTEFSLSQMWITGGSGSGLQTVETGWQVYRQLYGDNLGRLFIYWTADDYGSTGCYNLDCSAFVQVSSSAVLGGSFSGCGYSTLGGTQCEIPLEWVRSNTGSHDWWLRVNGEWIGYYPNGYFSSSGLANAASGIDFGGEIVNTSTQGVHTTTNMGSGQFSSGGFAYAAYIRDLQYTDTTYTYEYASSLTPTASAPSYYDSSLYPTQDSSWGYYNIFFGGPGRPFSNTTLNSVSRSASTVTPQDTITLTYSVSATSPDYVLLGASLRPSGTSSWTISDPPHDLKVSLATGTNSRSRSFSMAGLSPGTYDLLVSISRDINGDGQIDGGDQLLGTLTYVNSITVTGQQAPTIGSMSASNVTATGATLNATVNPNGSNTSVTFHYGAQTTSSVGIGSGTSLVPVSQSVSGLSCGTQYAFYVTASNAGGTTQNGTQYFTTSACPPNAGFYVITPCRMIDTRNPTGSYGGPALPVATPRNIVAVGQCGIPSGAKSLSVNITAVGPAAVGWFTLYPGPAGTTRPGVSTINFTTGRTIANNALVTLGSDGSLNIYNGGTSATNFIIDVNGYFK